jgi:DNA gyrase subunit A
MAVNQISTVGRAAQGVRVIKLRENDELISAAKIISEDEAEKAIIEEQPVEKPKLSDTEQLTPEDVNSETEDEDDEDAENDDDDVENDDEETANIDDDYEEENDEEKEKLNIKSN